MPTVGNTSNPSSTQEWFGLNSVNEMAQLVTMPAGGPWLITQVGLWLAGKDMTATITACVWNAAGTLLAQSSPFTAASRAFSNGNNVNYVANVPSVQVSGGQQVYVGFHRHSDHSVQNGRYSSGSHLHRTTGDSPDSLSSFSTDSAGGIGAYVANYVTANTAPNAPTITTGGTQHNGRTVFYSWTHSDPDGDSQADAHFQLWTSNQVTLLQEYYMSAIGAATSQTLWATLPSGYNANSEYAYRVRTKDAGGLWGPWSGFTLIRPNTPPNVPTVNTPPTNTLTPTITSGGTDPDPGNSIPAIELEVRRDSDSALMWASGDQAFSGAVYAGTALAWGVTYRVKGRTRDQWGAWSAWSGWVYWTPVQPTGPTVTPNTTASKQNTLTPTLNLAYGSTFTDHEVEVRAGSTSGAIAFSDAPAAYTATTSKNVTPSGLSWGVTYYWRARIWVSGAWTAWSQYSVFKTNAEPTAPSLSMPESTVSPSGDRVVTTLTPVLKAVFNDDDKVPYGDAPTAASLEVRNNATDALITTLTSTAEEVTYSGTALVYGTTYKWRKRYTDNASRQGPFSAYQTFRPTRSPTAALVAPAAASVVTDSTPLLDWSFSSLDGKTQYSYQITIQDKGPTGANYANPIQVFDSGEVISSNTSHTLSHGTLDNGHDYSWSVTVKDTDGLTYVLS